MQLVAALSMALPTPLCTVHYRVHFDANREHVTLITWISVFMAQLRQTNANEMFCWNFDHYSFYYTEL